MKIKTAGISLCLLVSAFATQAGLLIQELNVTSNHVASTTAPSGDYWLLSGTVQDLSRFSGTANPFNWKDWGSYTVSVSDGVLTAEIDATTPRLLTDTTAYSWSMNTYRYLELEFSREAVSGEGKIYFRKDGNSVATSGQNGQFAITDAEGASTVKIILDMQYFAAWTDGNLTGLGLELHSGAGTSILNTSDVLYSVKLSSEVTAVPEPATMGLVGFSGIGLLMLRRLMM